MRCLTEIWNFNDIDMNIGDKAPEILGINEKGEEIRLSDYKGQKVVLYTIMQNCARRAMP